MSLVFSPDIAVKKYEAPPVEGGASLYAAVGLSVDAVVMERFATVRRSCCSISCSLQYRRLLITAAGVGRTPLASQRSTVLAQTP
jgi:hypothetical protein